MGSRVYEKYFEGDFKASVAVSDGDFIVHIADCKGWFQDEFLEAAQWVKNFKTLRLPFEALQRSKDHIQHDCTLMGTFSLSENVGSLFLHSGEDTILESQAGTLNHLSSAARDMLAKLPRKCTIHSRVFSLDNIGGPHWQEIKSAFNEALKEAPEVTWLFWCNSSHKHDTSIEIPQLSLSINLENINNTLKQLPCSNGLSRAESLQSNLIFAEMDADDDLYYVTQEPAESAEQIASKVKRSRSERSRSFVSMAELMKESNYYMTDTAMDAEISSLEKNLKSRVHWTVFPDYVKRKSRLLRKVSDIGGNIRSTVSMGKASSNSPKEVKESWKKKSILTMFREIFKRV